ncbi:MAG: DUF1471 domain-containing protein [Deltaproteobacteria bacterium]|nr:DUF1471 domain-containing protein [Deltaproteobacteria bacterium]
MNDFRYASLLYSAFILTACAAPLQSLPEVAVADHEPPGVCMVVDVVKANGESEQGAMEALQAKAARRGADFVHVYHSSEMGGGGHHLEGTAFNCRDAWTVSMR